MEATPKAIDGAPTFPNTQGTCHSAIVAIVGPDGTGKSTTIDELRRQLESNGSRVSNNIRHWRPGVLPTLGRLTSKGGAESQFGGPPRRSPGRFQFLRLAYYGLDFVVGHFLQDNREKRQKTVVLYDRCALDMHVDPLRFALQSTRGTGLLWKIVPRPDAVILLYDSPGRILARKAELTRAELQRQFSVWIKLLAEGQVDAVVRIDSMPGAIARRIASYLNEKASSDANISQGSAARRRMLDSVLQMLASAPAESNPQCPREQDASSPHEREFAVVPSLSDPRFLIPLGSRKSAANSLRIYSAHKPLARTYKWVLEKGLRTGLVQPCLRQRTLVRPTAAETETLQRTLPLEQYLAQALGQSEVFLGVSLGTPSAHQKPLFQVMDREGRALAYAKIGWNDDTIRIVKNEAQALQRLAGCKFTNATIPRVLIAEHWKDHYLLLQSGPPSEGWTPSRDISANHLQFLSELSRIDDTKTSLQKSIWWKSIQQRIKTMDEMGVSYDADLVQWALDESALRFGMTEVPFGMKHGDFTPWNLLQKKQELFVLDWEYAESHAPPGSDLFHFVIQRAALVNEAQPKNIARDLLGSTPVNRMLREYFVDAGLEVEQIHSFLALYAADTLSWHVCRDQGRKDPKSLQTRKVWRHLLIGYVCRNAPPGLS